MSEWTQEGFLALPDAYISAILRLEYGMDVRSYGVGAIIVNGKRWDIPRECTQEQAHALIREKLS